MAVMVSCFYWVVARGSPDGKVSVDDVDREFWKLLENYSTVCTRATEVYP